MLSHRIDPLLMSHGAAAELTFAAATPRRYKSSMVGLQSICSLLFFFLIPTHLFLNIVRSARLFVGFRKAMVDGLKAVGDNENCSWFIDSCFSHCQAWFDNSPWNSSPVAPRLGNKVRMSNWNWSEFQCKYDARCLWHVSWFSWSRHWWRLLGIGTSVGAQARQWERLAASIHATPHATASSCQLNLRQICTTGKKSVIV